VNADDIIARLGLRPLPIEGGYFVETYRSSENVPASVLPARYGRDKALSTAICFLLTPDTFSAMHRLRSDEVFHFYCGDPVEMLHLCPDGGYRVCTLGNDIMSGEMPQVVVPAGTWQGCRLVKGGSYALMGTTVAPAFDYDDYEQGDRDQLTKQYPECAELIRALTRI
jgi:predicted cupin superfamily sugar epimerase